MLPPQGPDEDVGLPREAADGGEYVLMFPVPGPEGPGKFVLLTLTPDGRPAAVAVDHVTVDDCTVRGQLNDEDVVVMPKEAPWILLRRELLRYQTKAEVRKAMAEAMGRMFEPGVTGGACPVHGEIPAPSEEPAPGAEVDERRGYL
jgi:hypothetical protein